MYLFCQCAQRDINRLVVCFDMYVRYIDKHNRSHTRKMDNIITREKKHNKSVRER